MAENPLFYKKIVPLNREKHGKLRLDTGNTRFGFAAQANMIPAVFDEFVSAAHALPIVFLPGSSQPTAVFLTGPRPNKNVFVDAKGNWAPGYIPAFLRRYPFIIGDVKDANSVVCIDEDSALFSKKNEFGKKSEPLFTDKGEDSELLKTNIKFINEYLAAAKRTEAFLTALQELDLLRPVTINVRLGDKDSQTLHGLLTIDAEKLASLSDADFLDLRKHGFLPAIYAQQISLTALERLSRLSEQAGDTSSADKPEPRGLKPTPALSS
jgi:hypothetical protein